MRAFHKYLCYRSKSVSDSSRIFTPVGLDFKYKRKTTSSNTNLLNFHFGIMVYDCRMSIIASVCLFRRFLVHVAIDLRNHFGFDFDFIGGNENVSEFYPALMYREQN